MENQRTNYLETLWDNILNKILSHPSISELQANGDTSLFVRQNGKRVEMKDVFKSVEDYNDSIIYLARKINPNIKTLSNNLEEGKIRFGNGNSGRCHILLPPSVDTPQVTITKKDKTLTSLEDILASGSINTKMYNFIKASVECDLTIVFSGSTGAGKALIDSTLIPTPKGLIPLKNIKVGDYVFTPKGKLTKVTHVFYPNVEDAYIVSFSNNEKIIACADHNWYINGKDKYTTKELLESKLSFKGLEIVECVDYKEQDLPVDCKSIGLYLGVNDNALNNRFLHKFDNSIKYLTDLVVRNSKENRMNILIEILHFAKFNPTLNQMIIKQNNLDFAKIIQSLINSLGYNCSRILDDNSLIFKIDEELKNKLVEKEYILDLYGEDYNYNLDFSKERLLITSIKPYKIKDNDNFMCITVEDESHQFLASEYYIPTGNTTMLEATSKNINPIARISVVEDAPELELIQPNVSYLHSYPWKPGMNPNDEVTLDWLTAQVNRNRSDKVIVGECRGKEFKNFIIAASSGMDGSMTTLHSPTPRKALEKMTLFYKEGMPSVPTSLVNKSIATTIDIIVQLFKTPEGKYVCTHIEEVSDIVRNDDAATISTNNLCYYDEKNDRFVDNFLISDKLKNLFTTRGYNLSDFTKK